MLIPRLSHNADYNCSCHRLQLVSAAAAAAATEEMALISTVNPLHEASQLARGDAIRRLPSHAAYITLALAFICRPPPPQNRILITVINHRRNNRRQNAAQCIITEPHLPPPVSKPLCTIGVNPPRAQNPYPNKNVRVGH